MNQVKYAAMVFLSDMVLSQGDTKDYETMYNTWRGGKPSPKFMEKARGLN